MEWNRRNVLLIVLILLLGFGSGGVIYVHQEGGWRFAKFRFEKWISGLNGVSNATATESEIRDAKKKVNAVMVKSLAAYPELQIHSKSVAPERNGFQAFLQLKDDPRLKNLANTEIIKNTNQQIADLAVLERELHHYEEIGDEIERIAMLTEQSTEGLTVEYDGYIPGRDFKTMVDYLLLKARIAAMHKNEDQAFRYISMAIQLTNHLYDIEKPTIMTETIFVLCRLSIRDGFMNHVLPQIGAEADLVKWKDSLKSTDAPGDRFSKMIRGEWSFVNQNFGHSFFIVSEKFSVPDPDSFYDVYAPISVLLIHRYKGVNLQDLLHVKHPDPKSFGVKLSRESYSLLEQVSFDSKSWLNGYIRKYTIEAQHDAAMDLLIREKAGEDLSKLTETYVLNPYSGKPFPYDGAKRVLPKESSSPKYSIELKLPW